MNILRLPRVLEKTGLSRSTTYAMISDGQFPAPVRIGRRAVGWVESEADRWLTARVGLRG